MIWNITFLEMPQAFTQKYVCCFYVVWNCVWLFVWLFSRSKANMSPSISSHSLTAPPPFFLPVNSFTHHRNWKRMTSRYERGVCVLSLVVCLVLFCILCMCLSVRIFDSWLFFCFTCTQAFFYRCIYISGKHTPTNGYADYAWLTKEEVHDMLGVESAALIM